MTRPAPYPADTRSKGWRFELDHERISQSSTWALAGPEGRPWLLMLWMTAWQQAPCGSLPDDEEVVAALIGCPPKTWAKLRKALLRGWQQADDGRLYHATITERVLAMVEQRTKTAKRVADYKAKLREQHGGNALPAREPQSKNDTGTGTGTGTGLKEKEKSRASAVPPPNARPPDLPEPDTAGHQPTQAGAICRAMKAAGLQSVNPGDPRLLALIEQGATETEFVGIAAEAVEKRKGFAWVLTVLQNRRSEAAQIALAPPAAAAETPYARKMREQYEVMAPSIAAQKPGALPTPITFDMEVANAPARLTE